MKPNTAKCLNAAPALFNRFLRWVLVMVAIWGCAASPPARREPGPAPEVVSAPQTTPLKHTTQGTVEQRLRRKVHEWWGTPHRMGGTRRSGVDCSGFVQRIFNDLFNIKLPRSTALQVHTGKVVALDHLRPGDLVFFRPPHKVRHVGIYLGNAQFAHASTSRGVTISRLDATYWRDAYWTARRFPSIAG